MGAGIYEHGHDRLLEIPPPARNSAVFMPIIWVLLAMVWGLIAPGDVSRTRDMLIYGALMLVCVIYLGFMIGLATTRTKLAVTQQAVSLEAHGILRHMSRACPVKDFSIIGHFTPRRRWRRVYESPKYDFLDVAFAGKRARIMGGHTFRENERIRLLLVEWTQPPHEERRNELV